jgi:SnoaL-like domain
MTLCELAHSLASLETDYWYDVDHNWGRTAPECYVEDGIFSIGDKRMVGREAVRAFYQWRENRGDRTARHQVSNFRVQPSDGAHATLECLMCLYAADGAPVLESRPAIMIADVTTRCVCGEDGRWRMALHDLKPVFMGGVPPTIPLRAKA